MILRTIRSFLPHHLAVDHRQRQDLPDYPVGTVPGRCPDVDQPSVCLAAEERRGLLHQVPVGPADY